MSVAATNTARTSRRGAPGDDRSLRRPAPTDGGDRGRAGRRVRGSARRGRFVGGPALERFEAEFAAYCGADHAVGVNSGTDAIALALRAHGVGPGDEVVTAANTCVATITAIVATKRRPCSPTSIRRPGRSTRLPPRPQSRRGRRRWCPCTSTASARTGAAPCACVRARPGGGRGRLAGARRRVPRLAVWLGHDGDVQLLPDQEPRRPRRRGSGGHERCGGRRRAAPAPLPRRAGGGAGDRRRPRREQPPRRDPGRAPRPQARPPRLPGTSAAASWPPSTVGSWRTLR